MRSLSKSIAPVTLDRLLNAVIRVSLQKHISTLRQKPSAAEKVELLERQCHLMVRITTFERKGNAFLKLDDHVCWVTEVDGESMEEDEIYYSNDANADDLLKTMLETKALALPSSLAPGEIERLGLNELAGKEAALRRGQINDALEGLQMALGEKYLSYSILRSAIQRARGHL